MIGSQLKLNRLNWGRQVRVKTANHLFKQMLFRYQGHIGAYLVLAGADVEGGHLYTIHAHGSTDKIPYTAMGSGTYEYRITKKWGSVGFIIGLN